MMLAPERDERSCLHPSNRSSVSGSSHPTPTSQGPLKEYLKNRMVTGVTIPRGSKNHTTIPTTVLLVGSDSVMYRATSLMSNTNSS